MIRVSTFLELHANDHALGLYCVGCNRWGTADLQRLIANGRGHSIVSNARFRCEDCGAIVQKQLRPPVPALGNTVKYISAWQSEVG
jgi:hypothetical protein